MVHDEKKKYQDPSARMATFDENWNIEYLNVNDLVAAGFYYNKSDDTVKCFECDLAIYSWSFQKDDNPWTMHYSLSNCSFIKRMPRVCAKTSSYVNCNKLEQLSLEENPTTSDTNGNPDVTGTYGYHKAACTKPDTEIVIPFSDGIKHKVKKVEIMGAIHREYVLTAKRMESFAKWPASNKQQKEPLVAAGFFYRGVGDETTCYYCGNTFKYWESTDVPEEKHMNKFPNCIFIRKYRREKQVKLMKEEQTPSSSESAEKKK